MSRISRVIDGTCKLQRLLSLIDALHKTTETLYNRINEKVRHVSDKFGRSLMTLPDELLSITMRFACASQPHCLPSERTMDLLSLSHVNKRFRYLALGMSDMWANISPRLSPMLIEAWLAWSKCAGLRIEVSPCSRFKLLDPYMDKVIPVAHRWRELVLDYSSSNREVRKILLHRCDVLDLPNLERFEFEYRGSTYSDDETRPVYLSWRTPKLQEISFRGIVPKPFQGASIKVVTMEFQHNRNYFRSLNLHPFHSFLRATPSIEKLRVDFEIPVGFLSNQVTEAFQSLTMNSVHTLELSCRYSFSWVTDRPLPFHFFMQSLDCPNLRRVYVLFRIENFDREGLGGDIDISDLVFGLIPASVEPSPIQDLEIRICTLKPHQCFLSIPFQKFPALRVLSLQIDGHLKAPPLLADETSTTDVFPVLERVELNHCKGGTVGFLRSVVGIRGHHLCLSREWRFPCRPALSLDEKSFWISYRSQIWRLRNGRYRMTQAIPGTWRQ